MLEKKEAKVIKKPKTNKGKKRVAWQKARLQGCDGGETDGEERYGERERAREARERKWRTQLQVR